MLEQKLLEEINRFKSINRNASNHYLINEQEAPALPPAAPDAGAELPPAEPAPALDAAAPEAPMMDSPAESTEEVDVTDLVNMTKNIKSELEMSKGEHDNVLQKMDDVFSKLDDLEVKLSNMDAVLSKIDQLGAKVEEMKPQTPEEKLEMRSLDSYPFNQKPQEFFNHKQSEMKQSGKNEYVLTKDDVTNYDAEINKTFNPDEEQDEYSF